MNSATATSAPSTPDAMPPSPALAADPAALVISTPPNLHMGYAKAGVEAGVTLREFPVSADALAGFKPGDVIGADTFAPGQLVDVTGTTKGRGFSGVVRRYNFGGNRASHGNSVTTRAPGSIGMAQDPGRVFPGKRMAGHYGSATRTVQTLTVVRVDKERGLLLVKGSVPGADGGAVIVRPSVKTPAKKGA